MNRKKYNQIRAVIYLFILLIVFLGVLNNSHLLATTAVITGLVFSILVRSKANIQIDEREKMIREKAAQTAYAIFSPTIGIGTFILLIPSASRHPVFAKGDFTYLESLGAVLAYLTFFLISVYAISYHYFSKIYGGGGARE
jgi:uncharacterized membrane protein